MTSTVLVAYQWATTTSGATVRPDGTLDTARAKPALSEYDQVAIELARQLADEAGARLVAVGVGDDGVAASLATKAVGSRGPDEIVVVRDSEPSTVSVAAALAQVAAASPDVLAVVTGDASADHGTRMVPALLAGLLHWPLLAEVSNVSVAEGGLRAVQPRPSGLHTTQVIGPAVVSATPDALTPRVPGMRDILAAAKKPVHVVDGAATAGPTTRVVASARVDPPDRRRRVIPAQDAIGAVEQLVNEMRTAGVL